MTDTHKHLNSKKLKFLGRIEKKLILLTAVLVLSLAIVAFNSVYLRSSELGVFSSVAFLVALGVVCGMGLYEEESLMFKEVEGWFTILFLITIIGSLLLYVDAFSALASMLMMTLLTGFFLVFLLLKKLRSNSVATSSAAEKAQNPKLRYLDIVLSLFVIVGIFASFYVLSNSKTRVPMFDVWYTIPIAIFFLWVFLSALMLSSLVFFRKGSSLHLVLIILVGFLFVSLYYLVWYPSLYGDPLGQLGAARYTAETGAIFAREYLISNGYWLDIIRYRGYYSVVVQLTRLLSSDIYWVDNVSIPLLWAVGLPFSTYAITCVLINKPLRSYPREALLAAISGFFLFRLLVAWGAAPTPNTLAFLFLFFTVPFILRWSESGGKSFLGLAVLGTVAAFMTHPMPGIFAAVFLVIALVFRKMKWASLKIGAIVVSVLILPLILGQGKWFDPTSLFSISNMIEFEGVIFTVPLVFAAVGFFLYLRQENINKSVCALLASFYALIIIEYYIIRFGGVEIGFSASRLLAISDFLAVPFVAVCLNLLPDVIAKSGKLQNFAASKTSHAKLTIDLKVLVSLSLILLISVQSVVTLYQAYPTNEVALAPTAYEADAINYIVSTAPNRFVVLSDTLFTNLAIGLLGEGFSYTGVLGGGAFGIAEWDYPIQKMYGDMVNNVRKRSWNASFNTLEDALKFAQARTVYFIVSERLHDFNDVVTKTQQILQVDRIFGDRKLYVFKYPTPKFEGVGPDVKVTYDDGTIEEVHSEFSYTIQSEVTYSVYLRGHKDYNITNYPTNWVFQYIEINMFFPGTFDNSSDVNSFIFIRGLDPGDRVHVSWLADDNYPIVKWKEDSFKKGWGPYIGYTYKTSPSISSDGSILTISWNFTQGEVQDYYYAKQVDLLADDNTYVAIRWKSSAAIAVSAFYYPEPGAPESMKALAIVDLGSYSADWSTTIMKLPSDVTISYVMVGISNNLDTTISGVQTLFVDYILLSAKA